MTYTRQGLIALALEEMGVPGAGQTASAEDTQTVDRKLNAVMADLALRDIYQWGDPDQIPDETALHLAVILAEASAMSFGLPKDEQKRLVAEARVRALQPQIASGQRMTAEYF